MRGKTAGLLMLVVSVVLAALLLLGILSATVTGLGFGVALALLGGFSRGFKK